MSITSCTASKLSARSIGGAYPTIKAGPNTLRKLTGAAARKISVSMAPFAGNFSKMYTPLQAARACD